jgi:short-subunit dehydrogenase
MARTALITGASSGLGAEFARQLAERGADLVLVARDSEALEEVAAGLRTSVEVEVLVADLTVPQQRDQVVKRLQDEQRPIEVLVNNAGYGLPLAFERNDIEDEVRHLGLHVEAPMRLVHAALGPMLERRSGRIINVASVAGFIPRSTYGAVKAWSISFSRWANVRYAPRGVTVTVVCLGSSTRDSTSVWACLRARRASPPRCG